MLDAQTYNELMAIRTHAQLLMDKADRLIIKDGKSKNKKGLSPTFKANLIARKRKNQKIKTA